MESHFLDMVLLHEDDDKNISMMILVAAFWGAQFYLLP